MKVSSRTASKALLRGMDANFNRAKEGLRVLEDIARFFLESKPLTAELKKLRHRLTQILLKFPTPYHDFLDARDSATDVGKKSRIRDAKTQNLVTLWVSNMKRSQEALRVMEEFSKIVAPAESAQFQKVRFSLYELEKKSFRLF